MKIRIIIYATALLIAGTMAGCSQATEKAGHEHDESLQLTAYNNDFEVYAEVTPLAKDKASDVVAHFTWLKNFKPLEEGTITATLTTGNEKISQTLNAPTHQGVYKFRLTPTSAGQGHITFDIQTKSGSSQLTSPNVTVYTDVHEAKHKAIEAKATSSNGVVFTKEMSWKVNFSTDSCRMEPFGQVIRTMAQVLPAQGDEHIVVAKAGGIVTLTGGGLTEGKAVKAGQALVTIESSKMADNNLKVRYQEAETAYRLAKAEYERKQSLAADRIVSESDLQKARSEYERAEANYRNLNSNFSSGRQTATTTIGGFIKQLHIVSGQYVEVGQPLVTITQNRNLLIRAEIQPRYYATLGNIVNATIKHGLTKQSLEELGGRLVSYGKTVDTTTPLIPITFEIQNKSDFLPGSFVEMFIRTRGARPTITVPAISLIEEMGNYFVYVQLTPEYFEKREVTIGQTDGIRTEILSGLNGTERVVTRGATLVKITQSSGHLDAESGHQH